MIENKHSKSIKEPLETKSIIKFRNLSEGMKDKIETASESKTEIDKQQDQFRRSTIQIKNNTEKATNDNKTEDLSEIISGTSLVVPWLRIHLPRQGMQI